MPGIERPTVFLEEAVPPLQVAFTLLTWRFLYRTEPVIPGPAPRPPPNRTRPEQNNRTSVPPSGQPAPKASSCWISAPLHNPGVCYVSIITLIPQLRCDHDALLFLYHSLLSSGLCTLNVASLMFSRVQLLMILHRGIVLNWIYIMYYI